MIIKRGSKGQDVIELQKALIALGFNVGSVDGDFGPATELQVEKFQESQDLLPDGLVGSATVKELNELLLKQGDKKLLFELGDYPDPDETFVKLPWVKVSADQVPGSQGYSYFRLRKDAASAYNDFRQEVLSLGGVITSAGAKRPLSDSKRSKSRSQKSMHYVGLAFDMALDSAMNNPNKDRYVIEETEDRRWNVWCKTENVNVPIRTVEGYTYHHTRQIVESRMFSITELAKKHGFEPIRARRYFMAGGHYTGAEWWHFQWEKGLVRGESTFGGELLKLYSIGECKKFRPWEQTKNCTFGVDWF
jgi:hypothetical protein